MSAAERRSEILTRLHAKGRVEVRELVEMFETSEVTIRTDLRKLEREGKLKRFHGGAQLLSTSPLRPLENEVNIERRYGINAGAKERIAKRATAYVSPGSSVILDSGSTTHLIALQLARSGNIIAITNNLPAADALAEAPDTTLVLCGGTYRHKTQSLHGPKAEQCLEGVSADILFIGADGIDPQKGITTFNTGYAISAVMADCARTIIAVVDSSKIGRVGFSKVLDTSAINILITDTDIDAELKQNFEEQGVEVVTV
ncbi:DeoR/GlpR family DNA-binding transcription regulator [Polycladidibacter hongkongensis]|uniref:DeoR/GlpR family DNA-binding transcription regulator n=1 Tax=Polycladidibacter hongkongensis TaxID=1647556 RepID=UPI00082B4A16|nr:DeoR/GlpR family DNA-binding transcription regulator [Pseudovibrio hongkongensis]